MAALWELDFGNKIAFGDTQNVQKHKFYTIGQDDRGYYDLPSDTKSFRRVMSDSPTYFAETEGGERWAKFWEEGDSIYHIYCKMVSF